MTNKIDQTDYAILRAKKIVRATTWSGDMAVNMTTIMNAARILAKYVEQLEEENRLLRSPKAGSRQQGF